MSFNFYSPVNLPAIHQPEILEPEIEVIPNNQNLLNWEVWEAPIYDVRGNEILTHKQLIRDDTFTQLQIVSSSYTPIRNEEFSESVYNFIEQTGLKLFRVVEHNNGATVLAYLKSPVVDKINGWDFVSNMIIGNSHDYSRRFFVGLTNEMLRCKNQFTSYGIGIENASFRVSHTKSSRERRDEIHQVFNGFEQMRNNVRLFLSSLADKKVTHRQMQEFVKFMLDIKGDLPNSRTLNALSQSISEETLELGSNAFGLFNGVTHYVTHIRKQKEQIYGNPIGSAHSLTQKAIKYLNAL